MTPGPVTQFGPYSFLLEGAVVDSYCTVTGLSADPVPAALVMRVLTEPAVISDLRAAFGPWVPVHISQSVTLTNGIAANQVYIVNLQTMILRAEVLRLNGTLRNAAGDVAAHMASDFLLLDNADVIPA